MCTAVSGQMLTPYLIHPWPCGKPLSGAVARVNIIHPVYSQPARAQIIYSPFLE